MTHYKSWGYMKCPKCKKDGLIRIGGGRYDFHDEANGGYFVDYYKGWNLYACIKCENIIFKADGKEKVSKTLIPENSSYGKY